MPKKEYHFKGEWHVRKQVAVKDLQDLGTNVSFVQINWHCAMNFTGFEICPLNFILSFFSKKAIN